jgi:hypothetical protein
MYEAANSELNSGLPEERLSSLHRFTEKVQTLYELGFS